MATSRFREEKDRLVRSLTTDLVESVAGLSTKSSSEFESENATLAVDFCLENLLQPRPSHLWQSPKDVGAFYQTLVDKLRAHSQHAKADAVVQAVSSLRKSLETDDDLFVSLLSLLHLLSYQPVRNDMEPDAEILLRNKRSSLADEIQSRISPLKSKAMEDNSDIPSESSEPLLDQDWLDASFSQGEDSEEEGLDDEEGASDDADNLQSNTKESHDTTNVLQTGSFEADVEVKSEEEKKEMQKKAERTRLHPCLDRPKEKESFSVRCQNALLSRLRRLEKENLQRELLVAQDRTVHEMELIRALLLNLQGNYCTAVLQFDDRLKQFVPRADHRLWLAHASWISVQDSLQRFCAAANNLECLRSYCREHGSHSTLLEQKVGNAVAFILSYHEQLYSDLEEHIRLVCIGSMPDQSLPFRFCGEKLRAPTILSLLASLGPFWDQADRLASIMDEINQVHTLSNRERVCCILNILYESALEDFIQNVRFQGDLVPSTYAKTPVAIQSPSLYLFFEAVSSQIEIASLLLQHGDLIDPHEEFFLLARREGDENQHALHIANQNTPIALLPIADTLLRGAKSILLLKHLCLQDPACLWPPQELVSERVLEDLYCKSTEKLLCAICNGADNYAIFPQGGHSVLRQDILLRATVFQPLETLVDRVSRLAMRHVLVTHHVVENLKAVRALYCMEEESMLAGFLEELCHVVDRDFPAEHPLVAQVLHKLTEEFAWHTRIPKGTLNPTPVGDVEQVFDASVRNSILTHVLTRDLEGRTFVEDNAFVEWLGVTFPLQGHAQLQQQVHHGLGDLSGIHALDGLKIRVRIESPLNVILDTTALAMYDALFTFLVQIKRVKYLLCQAQRMLRRHMLNPAFFFDRSCLNRISLQLAEHLHFVNNLHAYIMHRVIHVSWTEYLDRARSATSLDHLKELHHDYLARLCTQCLISPESPQTPTSVMQPILELLETSLRFRSFLLAILDCFTSPQDKNPETKNRINTQIQVLHRRFSRTYRFLLIMLTQRSSIGGVKHLDEVLTRLDFNQQFAKGKR